MQAQNCCGPPPKLLAPKAARLGKTRIELPFRTRRKVSEVKRAGSQGVTQAPVLGFACTGRSPRAGDAVGTSLRPGGRGDSEPFLPPLALRAEAGETRLSRRQSGPAAPVRIPRQRFYLDPGSGLAGLLHAKLVTKIALRASALPFMPRQRQYWGRDPMAPVCEELSSSQNTAVVRSIPWRWEACLYPDGFVLGS